MTTQTFTTPGTWTVPAGVMAVTVDATGGAGGAGVPPSLYRGSGSIGQPSATSPATVSPPTGWAPGDLHILTARVAGPFPTMTASAGWTPLATVPIIGGGVQVWARTAIAGDANPTVTSTGFIAFPNGVIAEIFGFRDPLGAPLSITSPVVTATRAAVGIAATWAGPVPVPSTSGPNQAIQIVEMANGNPTAGPSGNGWDVDTQTTGGQSGSLMIGSVPVGSSNVVGVPTWGPTISALAGVTFTVSSGSVITTGGKSGRVVCDITVTPGDVLSICPGGRGVDGLRRITASGGGNGSADGQGGDGPGAGSGGASSEVQTSGGTRLVVAPGGGGGGGYGTGGTAGGHPGNGGTPAGTAGTAAASGSANGGGAASGGTGGTGGTGTTAGTAGVSSGSGGAGGPGGRHTIDNAVGGGGGGGGFAGGGGGGGSAGVTGGGGGGGGSGLSTGVNQTLGNGVGVGAGVIVLTWMSGGAHVGIVAVGPRP